MGGGNLECRSRTGVSNHCVVVVSKEKKNSVAHNLYDWLIGGAEAEVFSSAQASAQGQRCCWEPLRYCDSKGEQNLQRCSSGYYKTE